MHKVVDKIIENQIRCVLKCGSWFCFNPNGIVVHSQCVFGLQNSKYWTEQYKTEQHNTRQNSTWQILIAFNDFFCFIWFLGDEMLFWYFRQLVRGTKSCVVVWWETKISVLYLKQFYKSNIGQLKLLCHVLQFLANQTHSRESKYSFRYIGLCGKNMIISWISVH